MSVGRERPSAANRWYEDHWRAFYARARTIRAYTSPFTLLTAFKGPESVFVQRCLVLLGLKPGDRVVDLCCGTGRLTLALARTVSPTGLAIGVDLSSEMLAQIPSPQQLPLVVKLMDACRTDLDAAGFDAVTIVAALHEMPYEQRRAILHEASRILRSRGRLLVGEHYVDVYGPYRVLQQLMFALVATASERPTFRDLLRRGLESEITEAGFSLIERHVLPRRLFQLVLAEKPH